MATGRCYSLFIVEYLNAHIPTDTTDPQAAVRFAHDFQATMDAFAANFDLEGESTATFVQHINDVMTANATPGPPPAKLLRLFRREALNAIPIANFLIGGLDNQTGSDSELENMARRWYPHIRALRSGGHWFLGVADLGEGAFDAGEVFTANDRVRALIEEIFYSRRTLSNSGAAVDDGRITGAFRWQALGLGSLSGSPEQWTLIFLGNGGNGGDKS